MVIKFSEVEGIEELKTEDGRAVLNAVRHNELVRGHLNKLSMNLSGLADQVSNESSLLTWINGEPAKVFGSTSKEIRLDLEQLGFQLDGLEVNFKGFVHLIESNLGKPYFDFDRIESSLNRPMEDVQFKINSAEQWIKESVADQLESFINSCPSTIHIDRLRLEFINEVNCQRMIEFCWREGWSKQISQLRSQLGSTCDKCYLVELGAQSINDDFERWALEIFKAQERHNLVDLILSDDDEPPPDYLQTLESFKTDLISSCLEMIEPATNLIKEIGCQTDEVTLQTCEGIRVLLEIEARRTEHKSRKRWRAQRIEISVEDLKIINNSLCEVCNSLNDLGHNRQALRMSYQQEKIDRTSLETLFSGFLENRHSLWRIKKIEDENKAVESILWMNESEYFDSKAWKESLKNSTPTRPFIHTDLPILLLCRRCPRHRLPAILKELRSDNEIQSAGFDPIKPISKRLEELRQRSNDLLSSLNNNLKASQSIFENLNDLDLKSWIDKDSKTQHSSLPTQTNFVDAISTLKDLKRELNDLGDSDHSAGMELITECWQGLSKRQDTVVVLKSFVDFSKLILQCDLSFENSISSLNMPPPSKSSNRLMPPSLGGRMTFNLSPVTDSPSYMISQKEVILQAGLPEVQQSEHYQGLNKVKLNASCPVHTT
ncbi:hypothetical protein PPACK8108_LOCUS6007 [Phakopsora pachyrhizi]|uniref:Uncharacterized protein n=1 Tax=Phakopsora pachyrhizi TaxID=170000 RepID=A0AAV0AQG8_PHAPC|nr:hypothetical protein PPACK8108_LOCUS6007 [Phakopsora pachyrhizi]